jgi:hypothetical protein
MLDFLRSPALVLGAVVALLYAALFHLWQGRTLRDLIAFAIASLAGFAVGQVIGQMTQFAWLDVGQVNMVEASLVSWLGLIVAKRLRM